MTKLNPASESSRPNVVTYKQNTDCWLWHGCVQSNGYGRVSFRGKSGYAHRMSYQLCWGAIPKGLELDHLCRNRACINPWHLEPVTRSVNCLRGDVHWPVLPGESNGNSRLTALQVEEIRNRYRGFRGHPNQRELGAEYGVSQVLVGKIVRGEMWNEDKYER